MTARRSGPRGARLVALIAGVALLVPVWTPAVPAASAAEQTAEATLTVAELTASSLTVSGTVTNVGDAPLYDVTAHLWRSTERLHSAAAVRRALTAETTTEGRWQPVDEANAAALGAADDPLAPGESRPFTVWGDPGRLGLAADASHWVGVDVRGRARAGGAVATLAVERTLVTLPAAPVPVATVVALSAPPRLVKEDLFLDDSLADDLEAGRLGTLLAAAARPGANWVIDAGLLAEVRDMVDGYRIQGEDGRIEGTRQDVAQAWLDGVADLGAASGSTSLVGTPDLAAAAALGDATILERAARATDAVPLDGVGGLVVLSRPDSAALAQVSPLGRPVVALDAAAPGVLVRAADADVVSAGRPAEPLDSPLLDDTALNRRAAEAALGRARGGVVRWVTTAEDAAAAAAPLPPGFREVPLADLLGLPAAEWTPPNRPDLPSPVSADTLPAIIALGEQLDLYGEVALDAGVGDVADAQVARAASAWWTPETQQAWLDAIDRRLAIPEGDVVTIDAIARFSMTGPTSEFPVTVTNHLADPATIRLAVDTDNPQRIRFVAPPEITIPPGASSTILLRAEAAGGGVVQAGVHAQTLSGRRLTPDTAIEVETTNFGVIGWVLVVASGIVLVVTTALRILQVRRQKKGADD